MSAPVMRITLGAGRNRPRGRTIDVAVGAGGPVEGLADVLRGIPPEFESWWMPNEYDDAYREGAKWRSSSGIATDADFHDEAGEHVVIAPDVADESLAAARAGELPGNLFHLTPRGLRIAFVFSPAVIDRGLRDRAARGAAALVAGALARLGLASGGSKCGLVVDPVSERVAQPMFAPNAIVGDVARSADVLVMRPEPYDPAALAAEAPRDSMPDEVVDGTAPAAEAATDFDQAVATFNADHPLVVPRSNGKCPACGHYGCFGQLADVPRRWSCFSGNHEKDSNSCGVRGPTCWHGDALDLAAHVASLSRAALLRRDGFLVDGATPEPKELPNRTPPTHDRDVEIALLACFLKDHAATSTACEGVGGISASDFFDEGTRNTRLAMLSIETHGGRPDELALRIELEGRPGPNVLADVLAVAATIATENAPILGKRVRDLAKARTDRAALEEIRRQADHGGPAALAAIEAACVRRREEFAPRGPSSAAWGWRTPEEIATSEEAKMDWIVPNMVARQHVTVFYAKPKVGKTDMVVAGILAPLSRGEAVFGHPAPSAPVLAVILSEETTGRWRSHVERFGLRGGRILTRGKIPNGVSFADAVDEAARFAASIGAAIVVVDTLTAHAGLVGDAENDAGKMGEAIEPVLRAAATHNVAFTLIHHVRKWSSDADPSDVDLLRGSGNFAAKVDFLVHVTKPSDAPDRFRRRELYVNGRLDCEPYSLLIEKVPGAPDRYRVIGAAEAESDPELAVAIVEALESEPLNVKGLVSETERRKADVLEQLNVLVSKGEVRCLKKGERPKGGRGKWFALRGFKLEADASTSDESDAAPGAGK